MPAPATSDLIKSRRVVIKVMFAPHIHPAEHLESAVVIRPLHSMVRRCLSIEIKGIELCILKCEPELHGSTFQT